MRENKKPTEPPAKAPQQGRSDRSGQLFLPAESEEGSTAADKPAAGVPIRRPISDAEYAKLKDDAVRGGKLRRKNVQEDR